MQHHSPAKGFKQGPAVESLGPWCQPIPRYREASPAPSCNRPLDAFDAIARGHEHSSRKERGMEPEHENEAFDSPVVHVLWLMPLGLFAFLAVAGLVMSLG